ncbi:MAG TPA: serine--tRNA ligase, partial [Lactobacillus sp.]|nr:serine--tRNA ligase [Lactobacillus sp.]
MLDLKLIRQRPEWAKKKLAARAIKGEEIDELLALDEKRRKVTVQTEELKAQRNEVSGKIAVMKRNKENADDQIAAMREVGQKISALDKELAALNDKVTYILVRLPNFPADDVPMSLNEDDSREEYKWGKIPSFDF